MLVHNFTDFIRVVAHEAGHGVAAWASPLISSPVAIRLFPLTGEGECEVEPLPEPSSTTECLEFASLYLGGIAGETVALGDFECLAGNDYVLSLDAAVWVRKALGAPRRRYRRRSQFLSKLPQALSRELHGFLDQAYDLAISRVTAHKAAHDALRDLLAAGYAKGQIAWDAAELAARLGPKPA